MSQGELFRWSDLAPITPPEFFDENDTAATARMNGQIEETLRLRHEADSTIKAERTAWTSDSSTDRRPGFEKALAAYHSEVAVRELLVGYVSAFREALAARVEKAKKRLVKAGA